MCTTCYRQSVHQSSIILFVILINYINWIMSRRICVKIIKEFKVCLGSVYVCMRKLVQYFYIISIDIKSVNLSFIGWIKIPFIPMRVGKISDGDIPAARESCYVGFVTHIHPRSYRPWMTLSTSPPVFSPPPPDSSRSSSFFWLHFWLSLQYLRSYSLQ